MIENFDGKMIIRFCCFVLVNFWLIISLYFNFPIFYPFQTLRRLQYGDIVNPDHEEAQDISIMWHKLAYPRTIYEVDEDEEDD